MNRFAIKHKLKWGQAKCNVMRIGKHKSSNNEWKIGDMVIQETKTYKYLGDIITPNGKNTENLENRCTKLKATTININTFATGETLHQIASSVMLDSHEKICIPGLLTNCESWNLNKKDETYLERMEIQAIKHLFDLPIHTPTVAIVFTFGLLYTTQRIDQKQLIYLHKILMKGESEWPKRTLKILKAKNLGWYKKICDTLTKYELPTDFNVVTTITPNAWKRAVELAIERENLRRLKEDLYKTVDNIEIPKTKTKSIIDKIANPLYARAPEPEILKMTKNECKSTIISRYGMLECGANMKGTLASICPSCNVPDNEQHRLNDCTKWSTLREPVLVNFDMVYSNVLDEIRPVLTEIGHLWDMKYSNGTARKY